jgi:hypothetical protein
MAGDEPVKGSGDGRAGAFGEQGGGEMPDRARARIAQRGGLPSFAAATKSSASSPAIVRTATARGSMLTDHEVKSSKVKARDPHSSETSSKWHEGGISRGRRKWPAAKPTAPLRRDVITSTADHPVLGLVGEHTAEESVPPPGA